MNQEEDGVVARVMDNAARHARTLATADYADAQEHVVVNAARKAAKAFDAASSASWQDASNRRRWIKPIVEVISIGCHLQRRENARRARESTGVEVVVDKHLIAATNKAHHIVRKKYAANKNVMAVLEDPSGALEEIPGKIGEAREART